MEAWRRATSALAAARRRVTAPVSAAWRRIPARLRRPLPVTIAIVLAVLYPLYRSGLPEIPILGPFPSTTTAVVMLIFTMMALGLNIVVGYAGLLDLGYVAFYAMGAYVAAWLASSHFSGVSVHFGDVDPFDADAPGIHISVWLVLILAGFATAVIGIIIGLPTLRLRGDYLAIVTLGFGEIMPQVARNGDDFLGTGFDLTGGASGINPIDSPGFGSWIADSVGLPEAYITAEDGVRLFYWTGLVLLLITVFVSLRLRDSRLGRAWVAIREDETAAAAMGVPLARTKTWAYAIGAFFGGVAGAYFATFKSATFAEDFYFNISVFILCMVVLGGMGNVWGVIAGGLLLAYLDREGLANIGGWMNGNLGTDIDVPKYQYGIFGVIIVLVMLFRPQGLFPSRRRAAEFETGVHDEPIQDVVR
jgi:branched-chain amino acid transport system permease protein